MDPDRSGVGSGWTEGHWPGEQSEHIEVPALWNLTHPDFEGVAFYRREFAIPGGWQDQVLHLCFAGVSYRADVWLNGAFVGTHEGAYTPFCFDVTQRIVSGAQNHLVVRVVSLSKTMKVDGMRLSEHPASKQSWYYTHGGIWGAVCLEALPRVHCASLVIEADLFREVILVEPAVHNDLAESQPVEMEIQVRMLDQVVAVKESHLVIPPGTARPVYSIPIPNPVAWDCENPNLYRLQIIMRSPQCAVDSVEESFGMREFTVTDGQFFLNRNSIQLRGVLLQPNYPVTLVTPPTQEMMKREIRLAKEAGFNLIRVHIRPAPPGYLDLADEIGMLIYAESSMAWIKDSPRLLEHGRRELRSMIERDRNHPSVVFWGINNENRAASVLNSETLIRFVRALDPTRVVVDNSGGTMAIDQDFGWVDRATVVPSRSLQRQAIQDLHIYVGAPITTAVYEWLRTLGLPNAAVDMSAHCYGSEAMLQEWNRELREYRGQVFVSEIGCGGMADLDAVVAGYDGQMHLKDAREMAAFRDSLHEGFTVRGLDRIFGSVAGFIQATQEAQAVGLRRQLEALMANPRVSGYIITQLNDVAWEFHAGLMDHWRRAKPAYHAVRHLHQPHHLVIKAAKPVVKGGECIDARVTLVSRAHLCGAESIRISLRDPGGQEVLVSNLEAPAGTGIREIGSFSAPTGTTAGEYVLVARLLRESDVLTESEESVIVLPDAHLEAVAARVAALSQIGSSDSMGLPDFGETDLALRADPSGLSEEDWSRILGDVYDGVVAVIGPLTPRDNTALRVLRRHGLDVQLHLGIGNWMGCFHWIAASELFAGLPAGGVAGEPYAHVLPWYMMSELGGEVLAGSVRNTQTRREIPAMIWTSDIEAVRYGRGTLIFCQFRLFDKLSRCPLTGRLVSNLLSVARSIA